MTARDRGVIIGIVSLVLLGAAWFMLVAPEREKASKLGASIKNNAGSRTASAGALDARGESAC